MGHEELAESVPEGEALRYVADCRGGGSVGVTDERLLVADGDPTSVELGTIEEVTVRDVDYFVGSLSVALLGIGILAAENSLLVGGLFLAAGVASLVLVYRKRGKVMVDVRNRAKPLVFYLDDHDEFLDRLDDRLDSYEARLWAEAGGEESQE